MGTWALERPDDQVSLFPHRFALSGGKQRSRTSVPCMSGSHRQPLRLAEHAIDLPLPPSFSRPLFFFKQPKRRSSPSMNLRGDQGQGNQTDHRGISCICPPAKALGDGLGDLGLHKQLHHGFSRNTDTAAPIGWPSPPEHASRLDSHFPMVGFAHVQDSKSHTGTPKLQPHCAALRGSSLMPPWDSLEGPTPPSHKIGAEVNAWLHQLQIFFLHSSGDRSLHCDCMAIAATASPASQRIPLV